MSAPKKPTAREVWEAIDETSFRAEVDRVNAMSDAEVEAELLKDGFDPADLGLTANEKNEKAAPHATTGGGNGKEDHADANKVTPAKLAPVRRLPVAWRLAPLAAAATVAMAFGGRALLTGTGGSTTSTTQHAAELREQARESCAKAQWRTCLDRLDEADEIDRPGADDPRVRDLRHQAEQGLGGAGTSGPR